MWLNYNNNKCYRMFAINIIYLIIKFTITNEENNLI